MSVVPLEIAEQIGLLQTTYFAQELLDCPDRPKLGQSGIFRIFDHERYPDQSEYLHGLVADQTICGKMP